MLNSIFFSNTILEYIIALIIVVGALLAFKVLKFLALEKLKSLAKRTSNDFDDFLIASVDKVNWPLFAVGGLYAASMSLELPDALKAALLYSFVIVATYRAVSIVQGAVAFALDKAVARKGEEEAPGGAAVAQTLGGVVNILIWIVAIILVLSNFGINVTSLIAGLGIGGIAIALAAQSIFKDVFSAITIYLDKPFEVGDFIIFGSHMGTVEKIGIKTTRITSLQGEGLVVANSDLLGATIQNYKKMERRRMTFMIGVTYDTPVEKLRNIPGLITSIIEGINDATPNRCHFKEYADFSLNFETVFYIESADFIQHMDILQEVNLAIKEAFEKEGIEMAFPTQTVYLKKEAQ